MMDVTQEMRSGWCVVAVRGRADAETADELEAALRAALEANAKVAADFAGLDYISSAGLRAVLQAARSAGERKAESLSLQTREAPKRRIPAHERRHTPYTGVDHNDRAAVQPVLPSLARAAQKEIGFPAKQEGQCLRVTEEEVDLEVDTGNGTVLCHQQEWQGRRGLRHEDPHLCQDKVRRVADGNRDEERNRRHDNGEHARGAE